MGIELFGSFEITEEHPMVCSLRSRLGVEDFLVCGDRVHVYESHGLGASDHCGGVVRIKGLFNGEVDIGYPVFEGTNKFASSNAANDIAQYGTLFFLIIFTEQFQAGSFILCVFDMIKKLSHGLLYARCFGSGKKIRSFRL